MKSVNRRTFVKSAIAAGATMAAPFSRIIGANDEVRIGIVGFNSHGRSHIKGYQEVPGVKIVALCDVDSAVIAQGMKDFFNERGQKPDTYSDIRKLLEDKNIDAISGATPNHWHALSTIWACQAGKDVCVEKPVSHNIFEGRKMVEAARKYNRIVQADLDRRSSAARALAIQHIQEGNLGKILCAHSFVFKRRKSMGKVGPPISPPKTVDYDLWSGPAPKKLVNRKKFHYDWHWQWIYGGGEATNNGPHALDEVRWALGHKTLPQRVMSFGGRFGYDDDGETPNTLVTLFDYPDKPIYFHVRGLPRKKDDPFMDANHIKTATGVPIVVGKEHEGTNNGSITICENGYLAGSTIYDNDGKEIKRFTAEGLPKRAYFPLGVKSRKLSDLRTDILEGHISTSLCHLANISYRIGQSASPGEIKERVRGDNKAMDLFEQFQTHLDKNGVDLKKTKASLGPWLEFDAENEKFTGGMNFKKANELLGREYRSPFVVPEKV
jgi:predicted dehydrogenase